MTGRRRHEDGATVVEVALVVPAVALLLWLLLWAGTAGQTPGEVNLAASDAARAAAATRDATARAARADTLARDRLDGICDHVTVDTRRDDQVLTVTVACRVQTDPQRALGVPPRTFSSVGVSTIDVYFIEGG